ncbi:MAG: hypothetical protein CM15mP96_1400 [Gammaproteobacteria bacterium]|nr:MAG: hypothetical protein CM15mP96_1400 [Gammaproteobacteria bacterium]
MYLLRILKKLKKLRKWLISKTRSIYISMDNSPIDYLKDTTDDGITLIDSSESFDMQDSLKEYILDRLSKNRGKDIVLKELESDYLKIAIKDKKT